MDKDIITAISAVVIILALLMFIYNMTALFV